MVYQWGAWGVLPLVPHTGGVSGQRRLGVSGRPGLAIGHTRDLLGGPGLPSPYRLLVWYLQVEQRSPLKNMAIRQLWNCRLDSGRLVGQDSGVGQA